MSVYGAKSGDMTCMSQQEHDLCCSLDIPGSSQWQPMDKVQYSNINTTNVNIRYEFEIFGIQYSTNLRKKMGIFPFRRILRIFHTWHKYHTRALNHRIMHWHSIVNLACMTQQWIHRLLASFIFFNKHRNTRDHQQLLWTFRFYIEMAANRYIDIDWNWDVTLPMLYA